MHRLAPGKQILHSHWLINMFSLNWRTSLSHGFARIALAFDLHWVFCLPLVSCLYACAHMNEWPRIGHCLAGDILLYFSLYAVPTIPHYLPAMHTKEIRHFSISRSRLPHARKPLRFHFMHMHINSLLCLKASLTHTRQHLAASQVTPIIAHPYTLFPFLSFHMPHTLSAFVRFTQSTPEPDRPLRIGYISPDFFTHSVSYFIEVSTHIMHHTHTPC